MADRDRAAAQRPEAAQPPSSIGGFLPSLFGRRTSSKAAASSHLDGRKASASSGISRESFDETRDRVTSPLSGSVMLPSVSGSSSGSVPTMAHYGGLALSNTPSTVAADSAGQFHLDPALQLMQPGNTKSTAELVEIVKATSVHLANILIDRPATSGLAPPLADLGLTPEDVRTLYNRVIPLAAPASDYALRTAAIRLLAVLITIAPPRDSVRDPNPADLPATITPRLLYQAITAPGTPQQTGAAHTNQLFVQVAALKPLTRDGAAVQGMDGIVGWLLQSLGELSSDWLAWSGLRGDESPGLESRDTPFGPIKSATPAVTAAAAIDLIAAIVQHRTPLFGPGDLTNIVFPIIDFLWQGMLAAATPPATDAGASATGPGTTSAHSTIGRNSDGPRTGPNSPAALARNETSLRRASSMTVGRVEPFPTMTKQREPSASSIRKPTGERQVKWARPFKSLCGLVHMLFETTTINDDLFDEVFELVCFAFGQDDQDAMMAQADGAVEPHELMRTMLGAKSGRRGELALRKSLEGKLVATKISTRRTTTVERKVTRGAVAIARLCIEDNDFVSHSGSLSFSFTSLTPSLVAAESCQRFPGTARAADWAAWSQVDIEILALLDSHLSTLESGAAGDSGTDDAWTEGEAACEILDGLIPLIQTLTPETPRTLFKSNDEPLAALFGSILLRIPRAIGGLHTRLHTSNASSSSSSSSLPATQPVFYHPKYIKLLLDLSNHLDEEVAGSIIDYYQRECLCLPFTAEWIRNIWRLLEAFGSSFELPAARLRVSTLLYQDVYAYVDDLPEHRAQLVDQVIVPYLQKWLPQENDEALLAEALDVLVSAAVSETILRDDERRRARAQKAQADQEAEDALVEPSQELTAAASGGSFTAIRKLLTKLAYEAPCEHFGHASPGASNAPSAAGSVLHSPQPDERQGRERMREPSGLRGLMRTLSPNREPSSGASGTAGMSQLLFPPTDDYFGGGSGQGPNNRHSQHMSCKSLYSVKALIAIFTRLAFSAPHPLVNGVRPMRTPASSRCITVFRDLINLLFPLSEPGQHQRLPAKCPRARLAILQWSMRLRADRKHRVLFRDDINRFVEPFAKTLFRTRKTEEEVRVAMEQDEIRRRARESARPAIIPPGTRGDEDRGRSARIGESSTRSRSRSKAAGPGPVIRTMSGGDVQSYNPLWCVPETLMFEVPPENHASEGLLTYDPNHPSLRQKGSPFVEGVWLPVSEYLRMLNGLLRYEQDWELISYVLVFLPQQLGNKHFFHGIRATREVRGLLQVLCDGILEPNNRWERRFQVPPFIKRTHINSAAYQSISILISYRSVFDRSECERILQALVFGLEGNALLARPCLQTLTVCIYEMEQYVSKLILTILQKLQQILSTPAVAVHILEFLVALGNSSLYRNFTEDQYRLVFAVAIGYIAEHNARTDQPVDLTGNRDQFTLSQHVIGLAYHAIYLWFMALKVTHRPRHVAELVRGLLHAKSQRGAIDERMEVCFDWLARYTYGNADPKPATSFLSDVVMRGGADEQPPRTMSWLLGGAIVTVTSHQRTGWATITTTRPTGQTAVICKLENVPLLDLGEDNADMASLPATLMANREMHRDTNVVGVDQEEKEREARQVAAKEGTDPAEGIVSVRPMAPENDDSSVSGYVWSGAAPSQRRKDVVIEPSYLALQLLSSYPNATAEIPRGRMIPKDPKFERALRGIDNTAVINTNKIAVLYVAPGQKTETEILGNQGGSPLYLDFLAGLGRVIRLKGQVDVFTGGLDRESDSDGLYAYAWWDDLSQTIFHAPTLMPNHPNIPEYTNKKRLVGNDYVKIVYNESGNDFKFDTIRTAFNFVNIVISPYATRDVADATSLMRAAAVDGSNAESKAGGGSVDEWGGDSEDFFKVTLQRADGIPEFSPIGEYKLVSKRNLPVLVRQIAHYANSMAMRFQHTQDAPDVASAEFITIWRSRLRAIQRLRDMLPPVEMPDKSDPQSFEETLRDFTRIFSPIEPTK